MKSNLKPIQIGVCISIAVVLICGVMFFLLHKDGNSDPVYRPTDTEMNKGERESGRPPRADLPAGAPRLTVPTHRKSVQ